jgi:hypothetical protein
MLICLSLAGVILHSHGHIKCSTSLLVTPLPTPMDILTSTYPMQHLVLALRQPTYLPC